MLFSGRLSEQEVREAKRTNRQSVLEIILDDFRKAFPNLTFELQLDFTIINAQAIKLEDKSTVTLYGGLALHPRLGANSLTFILLHEVGHHLATGCRSGRDPSLACECASDCWAATAGMNTLLEKSGRSLQMRTALEELNRLMSPIQPEKGGYTKRIASSACWATEWHLRRRALLEQAQSPTNSGCCITYI